MGIAENIKHLRTDNNLTQVEFGRIAGVSDKAVSTWEAGIKEPRMGAIKRIAAHFGLSINDLVGDNIIPSSLIKEEFPANIIRIAGRDGSYTEKHLTDDQLKALKLIIDQMPDAEDI